MGKTLINGHRQKEQNAEGKEKIMFHTIGATAGEIWKLLKDEGPCYASAIASKMKQPQSIVNMGIGWLAREDKVAFTQTKQGMSISLKK